MSDLPVEWKPEDAGLDPDSPTYYQDCWAYIYSGRFCEDIRRDQKKE